MRTKREIKEFLRVILRKGRELLTDTDEYILFSTAL